MNRTVLVGRLTADPELRTTPNGIATCRVTLAVNRMPNSNGERTADFINVVIWRRQAENVSKYCSKGSLVGIDGRIQTSNYVAQDGNRRYITEVIADNVTFLGSKGNTSSNNILSESGNNTTTEDVPFPTNDSETFVENTTNLSDDPFKDFGSEVILSDDDLPF